MHKALSCPGAGLPCEQVSLLQQQTGVPLRLFEAEGKGERVCEPQTYELRRKMSNS